MLPSHLDELLEKIDDYWCEYVGCDISFMKKEISFIAEFLPLIDWSILPINQEDINAQLENIKGDDDIFIQKSKELHREVFKNIREYKEISQMSLKERKIRELFSCFFISELEYDMLILELAPYCLLQLGISEDLIIEKLHQHFGDILSGEIY